jgi:hypothetical protein
MEFTSKRKPSSVDCQPSLPFVSPLPCQSQILPISSQPPVLPCRSHNDHNYIAPPQHDHQSLTTSSAFRSLKSQPSKGNDSHSACEKSGRDVDSVKTEDGVFGEAWDGAQLQIVSVYSLAEAEPEKAPLEPDQRLHDIQSSSTQTQVNFMSWGTMLINNIRVRVPYLERFLDIFASIEELK